MSTLKELATSEIGNLIRKDVTIFKPEDTISKVLGELKKQDAYEALVLSDEKIGLISLRDLLDVVQPNQRRIGDHGDRWSAYRVVSSSYRLLDVTDIMLENNLRALPVIENGSIAGLISQDELMQALLTMQDYRQITAKELMKTNIFHMNIDESIELAMKKMLENNFSHIPVIKNRKLMGIVLAKDLVHTFVTPLGTVTVGERIGEKTPRYLGNLRDIMNSDIITARPESNMTEIIEKMVQTNKSACLITLEDNTLVGIITPREILSTLLRFKSEEELPVYIIGLEEVGDFYERAIAEEKIRRIVSRALRFHPKLSEISIKLKATHRKGNRSRFEVSANVYSKVSEEQFNVEKDGWDLMIVFDEVSEALDRIFRDSKHKIRVLKEEEKIARYSFYLRK
jgi:CBS domain-containing protein